MRWRGRRMSNNIEDRRKDPKGTRYGTNKGSRGSESSHYEKNGRKRERRARSRVICTYFYGKGLIEKDLWRADLEFTRDHLSGQMVRGYHFWAIPYVRLMRRSKIAENIMLPIARSRAVELAYQMGVQDKGSVLGKIVRLTLEPLSFVIGAFVSEQDYEALWNNDNEVVGT